MAKRVSYGGRPSKGPRDAMLTRLHPDVGRRVRDLAEEKDWTYSDTLEALICIALEHLVLEQLRRERVEAAPLGTASTVAPPGGPTPVRRLVAPVVSRSEFPPSPGRGRAFACPR